MRECFGPGCYEGCVMARVDEDLDDEASEGHIVVDDQNASFGVR